ncbi:MAG: Rrf2 family transcriptional regulator [Rhodobacteraceae bacterium]|nr:Rrf2 family transcriptional regulator [Paracoccaceae bacterium]
MPTDSRLPRILHVLLHLEGIDEPVTSDMIGKMLNTNPSLVRRTMGGLRKAGMVGSIRGHNGGWYLKRKLNEITLAEVYDALGAPNLFSVGQSSDAPQCLLERSANKATAKALASARSSFLAELNSVTVADLVTESRATIAKHHMTKDGMAE